MLGLLKLDLLLIFLLFALPIGWLICEFKKHFVIRRWFALLTIIYAGYMAIYYGNAEGQKYNEMYSRSTINLLKESQNQIEKGNNEKVFKMWGELKNKLDLVEEGNLDYYQEVRQALFYLRQEENDNNKVK